MSKMLEQHRSLKEAVELVLKETNTHESLASDVLTNVVIQTINTYQQKLNVGVQDSVADLIETFKQKVSLAIFDTGSNWKIANREPFMFPRGCRFAFSKGQSTVFVIEQEPQVRSLMMSSAITGEEHQPYMDQAAERVTMAFPYVTFIMHFKNGRFSSVYTGWRTAPLKTMDDLLCKAILPNIHTNLNVCMGHHFTAHAASMSEQTEEVLSNFWNSRFNNDLSVHWWNKPQISDRLRSTRAWSAQTVENPLFILQLDLSVGGEQSVRHYTNLITMHEEEPDENSLRHRLSEDIDNAVEGLFSKIMRYFKKTKFDKYHPKEIKDGLASAMKSATGELADLLLVIQHELEGIRNEIEEGKRTPRIEPKGPLWGDYSP